jgi:hypothetical protein
MRLRNLILFLKSAVVAAGALRFRSLASIVHTVHSRKIRSLRSSAARSYTEVLDAVSTFEQLRPLAFSAHDNCLYDSLTLIEYLAHQWIFPNWVIGVRTRPFLAHSWVQMDTVVLNDLHEHVGKFVPIMVI